MSVASSTQDKVVEIDDYESLPDATLLGQAVAGAVAGIAEHTVMYPIDAIKVSSVGVLSS
jgi:solute carrier family 25 (mitochondrial iron transporter), member 28/37